MSKGHRDNTCDFDDLDFGGQAKSLNANFATLGKAVRAHLRLAKSEKRNVEKVHQKCIAQATRLLKRITK